MRPGRERCTRMWRLAILATWPARSRTAHADAHEDMRSLAVLALPLALASPVRADSATTDVRAAYAPGGDLIRLTTGWGEGAAARLQIGKARAAKIHDGASAG